MNCLSLACKCTSMRWGGGGGGYTGRGISGTVQEFRTHSRNFARIPGMSHAFQTYCTRKRVPLLKRKFREETMNFIGIQEKISCVPGNFAFLPGIQGNLHIHLGNLANLTFSPDPSLRKFHRHSKNFACFRGVLSHF
jgi:hypothetical protein